MNDEIIIELKELYNNFDDIINLVDSNKKVIIQESTTSKFVLINIEQFKELDLQEYVKFCEKFKKEI